MLEIQNRAKQTLERVSEFIIQDDANHQIRKRQKKITKKSEERLNCFWDIEWRLHCGGMGGQENGAENTFAG